MASFTCLHCGQKFTATEKNPKRYYLSQNSMYPSGYDAPPCLEVIIACCEDCGKESVVVKGHNGCLEDKVVCKYPNINYIRLPDYVPASIRSDYEEACQILQFSPKASATLARRCMQAMIHDCWCVEKSSLYNEIESLPESVPVKHKEALHALRQIGNIGAHMKKSADQILEVSPGEAKATLEVVEFLIKEWYVNSRRDDELLSRIIAAAKEK